MVSKGSGACRGGWVGVGGGELAQSTTVQASVIIQVGLEDIVQARY